jgi:hypothetical protein
MLTKISLIYKKINDNILPVITVGFPGGYKFLIVLLITSFFSSTIATDFSKIFFWVTLLVTFIGLPIASLMVSPFIIMTGQHKLILILISSLISFSITYFIEFHKYNIINCLFIYLSVISLSLYEILKRFFLNDANFKSLFISSCISVLLVSISLLGVLFLGISNVGLILMLCFGSLVLPLLYLQLVGDKPRKQNISSFTEVFLGFMKYALSNAASTSLLFVLPIVIIAEMGDIVASDLAQVFYFTTLTYLIPHALSAKHIPIMRESGIEIKDVKLFFNSILFFTIIVSVISLPLLHYFYQHWLIYFMLFIAMQISQLSIPCSNILMVKGEATKTLKVNLIASSILLIVTLLVMSLMMEGEERAEILLLSFIGFQLLKLLLNYIYTKEYIYPINKLSIKNE